MRVVAALGGNALLRRGQELSAENQRENARAACAALAPVALEHELVIQRERRQRRAGRAGVLALVLGGEHLAATQQRVASEGDDDPHRSAPERGDRR